jgi:4-hydroxybenzoyl-CoA thioesterase
MVELERRVRFEEVDAAGIVFFGAFSGYAHEAMEGFFDQVEGGYAGLINRRRIGFPAVRLEVDFLAPLRYGDTLSIATSVARLGTRSATLAYEMRSARIECARIRHTVVITDLERMKSTDMPSDVRAVLEAHLAPVI